MKKNYILIILLFLTGCPYDNINFHALKLQNSYFKTVYIVEDRTTIEIPINEIRGVFLKENEISNYKLKFYQNKTLTCYLFSLDNLNNKNLNSTVFVINEDGIHPIDSVTFARKNIKAQPHPYDASLCKPAPKESSEKAQ